MTDIHRPTDPYDLLQGHWPSESETAYDAASTQQTTDAAAYDGAADDARSAATRVAQEWLGKSGAAYVEQMHGHQTQLTRSGDEAAYMATQLTEAAGDVRAAKRGIVGMISAADPQIAAAEAAEREGKQPPGGKSSQDLIREARDGIRGAADQLDTQLDKIGENLERGGPPPAKTGQPALPTSYAHTPVEHSRQLAHQQAAPVAPPGQPGQTHAPTPTPTPAAPTPAAPAAPSAPAPQAPSAAPSPMSSPSSGGSPSGSGSPGSGGGQGSQGSGQGGSQSGGDQSGNQTGGPGSGDQGHGQPSNPAADPLLAMFAGPGTPFAPPTTTLTGVVTAATAPAAAAVSRTEPPLTIPASPPVVPATVTPGFPGPPGTAGAGVGLTAPGPSAPAAGGPTITNASMGPDARLISLRETSLAAAPQQPVQHDRPTRPVVPLDVPSAATVRPNPAAAVMAAAAAAAGGIDVTESPVGGFTSYLAGLPVVERVAHRALTTLVDQFAKAGWTDAPLGVGVVRQSLGGVDVFKAVYVTADGISMWTLGVRMPVGVLPLMRVEGVNGAVANKLMGCLDVRRKVETLVPESYGKLECILTSADQTADQRGEITRAREGMQATQARVDYAHLPAAAAKESLTAMMMQPSVTDESTVDVVAAREKMIQERWRDGVQPYGTERATQLFLIAEARNCWHRGLVAETGFSLGELIGPAGAGVA